MKILLVTSPHVRHPAVLQNDFQTDPSAMLPFIPIGLLSLASAVRSSMPVEPSIYDLNRRILDGTIPLGSGFYRAAAEALCSSTPDIVGFMTENESYHHVLQICQEVKKNLPGCIVALGGPHASGVGAATLVSQKCIDYVVKGEGEATFPDLILRCMEGSSRPIAGVWHRSTGGEAVFGGERALIMDLDSIPYPAYDLYQPEQEEEIFFEVGRGCPFQCTFCSTAPFWRRTHRVKSAARILEEIEHIVRLYGSRRMHFTHDLFTTNNLWVREVCQALIGAGAPIKWTCSSRTDTVNAELFEIMATAGCSAIYFGLESGSPRILREIKKHIDQVHSFNILKQCLDAGIAANVGFIGGFPNEDEQSLSETFTAFTTALEIGCAPVHMFQFTPFEDSSVIRELGERICTGHFLDLPLGHDLDVANREFVASDVVLFGAYHRPRRQIDDGIREGLIDALEEFPTLVSAALLPALALARAIGGMFALFKRWVAWISRLNEVRGAEPFRRYFGSPVFFTDFLIEEAQVIEDFPPPFFSLLRVIRMNHWIAGQERVTMATTMANYRTGLLPDDWSTIELSTPLILGDVLGQLEVPYDIETLLMTKPPTSLPESELKPMYLIWQRVEPRRVQLLKVDAFTFQVAERLQISSRKASDLLQMWVLDNDTTERDGNLFALMDRLEEAARLGIVRRISSSEGSSERPTL